MSRIARPTCILVAVLAWTALSTEGALACPTQPKPWLQVVEEFDIDPMMPPVLVGIGLAIVAWRGRAAW